MTLKRKKVIVLGIVAICVGICIWVGFNFGPGSYPFAERYKIQAEEETVIAAINVFFDRNEQYRLPVSSYLIDSQCKRDGYWYHVYVYLPEENRYLKTWIRESMDKEETTFALVAISKNLEPGNWLRVNDDLPRKENRQVKKKFEEEILEPIKSILKDIK